MAIDSKELDFDVIRQAQLGNAESLAYLAEHARDKLFVYLYRLTLNHNLAEDLTQETIVQMLQTLKQLNVPNRQFFWAWLYRTALGRVQHHFRHTGNKRITQKTSINSDQLKQYADKSKNVALQQLIRQEMVKALYEAFASLKLEHRTVLTLRCMDELPYTQIATILGGTELRVRLLFLRAKQSLKRRLTRSGFDKRYLLSALGAFAALTASTSKTVSAAPTVSASLASVSLGTFVIGAITSKLTIAALLACIMLGLVVGRINKRQSSPPSVNPQEAQTPTLANIWTMTPASEMLRAENMDADGWQGSDLSQAAQPIVFISNPQIIMNQELGGQYLLILPEGHWIELAFPDVIRDNPGADIVIRGSLFDTAPQVFVTDGAGHECLLPEYARRQAGRIGQTFIGFDISTATLTFEPRAIRIVGTSSAGPRGGFEFADARAITQ